MTSVRIGHRPAMADTTFESATVSVCPTCAALVREDDLGEHQKWHARQPGDAYEYSADLVPEDS